MWSLFEPTRTYGPTVGQTARTATQERARNRSSHDAKLLRLVMEVEPDEKELKAAGAQLLPDGRRGLRIHGWEIETHKRSILTSSNFEQYFLFLSPLSIVAVTDFWNKCCLVVLNWTSLLHESMEMDFAMKSNSLSCFGARFSLSWIDFSRYHCHPNSSLVSVVFLF